MSSAEAAERWHLEFQPVKMDRILLKTGSSATAYWYMIYQVKNPMDESVPLNLFIQAQSDVGKKTYVEWYSPTAVKAVAEREGGAFKNVKEMRGSIGPGETLTAVALFRNVHEGTDTLRIRVQGLWDRVFNAKNMVVVEDKVLDLYFFRPGDEYYPQFDRFFFKKQEWVVINRQERAVS
jgi:hypothetical protein